MTLFEFFHSAVLKSYDCSFFVVASIDDYSNILFFSNCLYHAVFVYETIPSFDYLLYEFVIIDNSITAVYIIDVHGKRLTCLASYSDIA